MASISGTSASVAIRIMIESSSNCNIVILRSQSLPVKVDIFRKRE